MSGRRPYFPVHPVCRPDHGPREIPWALIQPHERQAQKNHDQTLERLAERGGLSLQEMVAVLDGLGWNLVRKMEDDQAVVRILSIWRQWAYERWWTKK